MVSPYSPLLANLFLTEMDECVSTQTGTKLYLRYMDDIFIIQYRNVLSCYEYYLTTLWLKLNF